jgi:hypothetical protein
MKNIQKINYFILAIIFFVLAFSTIAEAAKLRESGMQLTPSMEGDKVTSAAITIESASGGPTTNSLKVGYPKATVLKASVSVTNKSGIYRITFIEKGKKKLSLSAKNGKSAKGSVLVTVNAAGAIQYSVTAIKAKNIDLNISFSPVDAKMEKVVKAEKKKEATAGNKADLKNGKKIMPAANAEVVEKVSSNKVPTASSLSSDRDIKLALSCLPGKNCRLRLQNSSSSKAYINISFEIEYKMMTSREDKESVKVGTIEEAVLPNKVSEWPLGLVFGEVPKDIKISLVKAEAIDPAAAILFNVDQGKYSSRPLASKEKKKKIEQGTAKSTTQTSMFGKIIPTSKQFVSLQFFESGADAVPYDARKYNTQFAAKNVRFINWELNTRHPAPGNRIDYDIEAVWIRSDGSLYARQTLRTYMNADWESPYASYSWGNDVAGAVWQPDTYTVDLYVGGAKIASGSFRVY